MTRQQRKRYVETRNWHLAIVTQNKNTNKITKSITDKHKMSITRALKDFKKIIVTKNEFLYTLFYP
jgi:hypothetical protein